MKKFIFGLLLSLMFPLFVIAESFVIDHYKVDMTINDDGSLGITEIIDVQFSEPKHGIERLLPQRYTYDDTHDEIVDYHLITTNVTQSSYSEGANLVLRLGDTDRTVDGSQQYIISYKASPGVKQYSGRQELYRNLIGTQWGVPIRQVAFRVTTPAGVDLTQITSGDIQVVAGVEGSEHPVNSSLISSNIIQGSTSNLGINEGVTIGIKFRDHSFKNIIQPTYISSTMSVRCGSMSIILANICNISEQLITTFSTIPKESLILLFMIIFILSTILYQLLGNFIKNIINLKKKKQVRQGVVIQYNPPVNFLPHEGALILDDGFKDRHFVATLYDRYYRGVITINATQNDDIIIKELNKDLIIGSSFEEALREKIFGESNQLHIKSLTSSSFMIDEFYETKTKKKFYSVGIITDQGLELYRYILGYRQFIKTVESNQLIEYLKEDPQYINKLIPWVIALGLDSIIEYTLAPLIEQGLIPQTTLYEREYIIRHVHSITSTQIAKRTAAAARAARLAYHTRSSFGSSGSSRSSSGGGRGGGGGRSR